MISMSVLLNVWIAPGILLSGISHWKETFFCFVYFVFFFWKASVPSISNHSHSIVGKIIGNVGRYRDVKKSCIFLYVWEWIENALNCENTCLVTIYNPKSSKITITHSGPQHMFIYITMWISILTVEKNTLFIEQLSID